MRKIELTCDGCGAVLSEVPTAFSYMLTLRVVTHPAVDQEHHFCDLACLDHWSSRRFCSAALMAAWWAAWKADPANAIMIEKPEARAAAQRECDAQALTIYRMEKPR